VRKSIALSPSILNGAAAAWIAAQNWRLPPLWWDANDTHARHARRNLFEQVEKFLGLRGFKPC